MNIKVLGALLFAFAGWMLFQIFKLTATVLERFGSTDIFVDDNALNIFRIAMHYLILLLVFVLGFSVLNVLAGYPLSAVLASLVVKFPFAHIAIIASIYLIGYILKLAIENRKDLEGTI